MLYGASKHSTLFEVKKLEPDAEDNSNLYQTPKPPNPAPDMLLRLFPSPQSIIRLTIVYLFFLFFFRFNILHLVS